MDSVSHLISVVATFLTSPIGLVWMFALMWVGILLVLRSRRNLEEAILMEARARGLGTEVQKMQIRRVNALIVVVWLSTLAVIIQLVQLIGHYFIGVPVTSASQGPMGLATYALTALSILVMAYAVFFTRSIPHVRAGTGKSRIIRLMA